MLTRLFLLLLALLASASSLLANQRPNIVFFFTDDQTTSTLGCYGNPIVETPNIDALARRGMRFENAFVSHSICWVSRTKRKTKCDLWVHRRCTYRSCVEVCWAEGWSAWWNRMVIPSEWDCLVGLYECQTW